MILLENITNVEELQKDNGQVDTYKVTHSDGVVSFVPNDERNSDYQEVQKWLEQNQ